MKLEEAREYFGSYAKLADAVGVSRSAVHQWEGVIPEPRQLQLHKLTKGALRADPAILAKYREILRAA